MTAAKKKKKVQESELLYIPLERIRTGDAYRKVDAARVAETAASIEACGLLHAVTVCQEEDGDYRLLAGHHRFAATKKLKRPEILALVLTDESAIALAGLVENVSRRDLSPLQEANAIVSLLQTGMSGENVAKALGVEAKRVLRRARLAELIPEWWAATEGQFANWRPEHLEVVARYPAEVQASLLDAFGKMMAPGAMTVALLLDECSRRIERPLARTPWRKNDAELVPEAGACCVCPARNVACPDLFDAAKDVCLNGACYDRKLKAHCENVFKETVRKHGDPVFKGTHFGGHPDALAAYNLERCDDSEPGARPCVLLDGNEAGRVVWIRDPRKKLDRKTPDTTKASKASKAADDDATDEEDDATDADAADVMPEALEMSGPMARVEARRRKAFVEAIIARLDEPANLPRRLLEGDVVGKVASLAAFMTHPDGKLCDEPFTATVYPPGSTVGFGATMPRAARWDKVLGYLDEAFDEQMEGMDDDLRKACEHYLIAGLNAFNRRLGRKWFEPDEQWRDAERIARMVGLDIAAMRAEVAAAVPLTKACNNTTDDWIQEPEE